MKKLHLVQILRFPLMVAFMVALLVPLLAPISCHTVDPKTECEQLAFGTFKGNPKSAQAYKKKCQQVTTGYTPQLCQRALEAFILHGDKKLLESAFGPQIMNCFTENDLKNFLVTPTPTPKEKEKAQAIP